jgi:hypothetical protein
MSFVNQARGAASSATKRSGDFDLREILTLVRETMAPVPEIDPPTAGDPEIEKAAKKQRQTYGRAATMLTGGQGLTGPAPTARRTLLGA